MNPQWRKSSYSTGNGGQCVETGHIPGAVLVRDTKDRDGVTLAFTANAWEKFAASVRTSRP
jgi:hypothetical protein